jgi:TP901 family phage tail tape measure protein
MGIEERVEVTGAEQGKRKLDQVADANERVGDAAEDSGRKGSRAAGGFDDLNSVLGRGVKVVKSMLGGLVGAAGLNAALRLSGEAAEQAKQELVEYVDAMAAVIALTDDPEILRIATRASIESGRSIDEIGTSLFSIASGTAGSTNAEQAALLQQSLEIAKTEPNVPLRDVVELIVRLRNVSGGDLSAQQLQNLAIATEDQGQVNIGELARFLPRTLKPGEVAGLELADTSAIFAVLSQILKPEVAGTATENILVRLAAPGDEAQKIFKRLGIADDASALKRLEGLVRANSVQPLDAEQFRDIVGEGPGAAGLATLIDQFEKFQSVREKIVAAAARGAPDLGAARIRSLRENLPGFAELEFERSVAQEVSAARRDDPEVRVSTLVRAALEQELLRQDVNPVARFLDLKIFDALRAVGADPGSALTLSLPGFSATQRAESLMRDVTVIGTQYNADDPLVDPPPPVDVGQ